MGKEVVKNCRVCGEEYETCYICEKANGWRTLTDTLDHYYLLCTLMEYQSGHDAEKAYRALEKRGFDFENLSEYLPHVQDLLEDIYLATCAEEEPALVEEDIDELNVAEPEEDAE